MVLDSDALFTQKQKDKVTIMTEMERAVQWLVKTEMLENMNARVYVTRRDEHKEIAANCRVLLVAMRQMRSEPCEWCDGKEDSLLVWTKDPVEIEWDDREYTTRGWTWKELKPNYCPNCGRKLVK